MKRRRKGEQAVVNEVALREETSRRLKLSVVSRVGI